MPEAIFECCNKITNSYNKQTQYMRTSDVAHWMTIGHWDYKSTSKP